MPKRSPSSAIGKEAIKKWRAAAKLLEAALRVMPVWVQNIVNLLDGSISKAHNFRNSRELTPAMIGTLVGQMLASSELFLKKPATEKAASPAVKKYLRGLRKNCRDFRPTLLLLARTLTTYASSFTLPDQSAFSKAKAKALDKNLNAVRGQAFFENDATRIYVVLLCLAPVMNKVKSVTHLHEILCQIMGGSVVGDLKRVERICGKIKLKFRECGRPGKEAGVAR
jgi:hypothetical protein